MICSTWFSHDFRVRKRYVFGKYMSSLYWGTWRNRSMTQFDGITKAVMSIATKRIEMITFFEDPLPDAEGTEVMLANVW